MEEMQETKPNSESTIRTSAHTVSANILLAKADDVAKPNMGREVHSSHGSGEGIGESEYLLNNNIIYWTMQFSLLP